MEWVPESKMSLLSMESVDTAFLESRVGAGTAPEDQIMAMTAINTALESSSRNTSDLGFGIGGLAMLRAAGADRVTPVQAHAAQHLLSDQYKAKPSAVMLAPASTGKSLIIQAISHDIAVKGNQALRERQSKHLRLDHVIEKRISEGRASPISIILVKTRFHIDEVVSSFNAAIKASNLNITVLGQYCKARKFEEDPQKPKHYFAPDILVTTDGRLLGLLRSLMFDFYHTKFFGFDDIQSFMPRDQKAVRAAARAVDNYDEFMSEQGRASGIWRSLDGHADRELQVLAAGPSLKEDQQTTFYHSMIKTKFAHRMLSINCSGNFDSA
ncbi:hypothetical protein Q7P37_000208 [Cladosporium fusiforme]